MRRLHSLVIGMLCALATGMQGQPAGAWELHFDPADLPLWDISGDYSKSNLNNSAQLTFAHQPDGKLTGAGTADFVSGALRLNATESSAGKVFGSANRSLKMTSSGTGSFAGNAQGLPLSGTFRGSVALTLDPVTRRLSGTETATFCVLGRGCQTVSTNTSFPLPALMDGSWSLALNVSTNGRSIRGTATATLANGRVVTLDVRGTVSASTRLHVSSASGGNFFLSFDKATNLRAVQGRFFGQRLAWRAKP